MFAPSHL